MATSEVAELFRVYAPDELGTDGYPPAWYKIDRDDFRRYGIKDVVREQAGHRCIRCGHPYRIESTPGSSVTTTPGHQRVNPLTGEMLQVSLCDDLCRHGGPVIFYSYSHGWGYYDGADETIANEVYAVWRVLTVHHLDGQKENCRWWNLCALCQRCHLTIQGRVVMERAFMLEHSEWMKPYASGWYAWKYLGEDITREEAAARQDELLGLERLV